MRKVAAVAMALFCCAVSSTKADIVFQNTFNNGYFTPFNSLTPAGTKYGDSGWLSNFQPGTYTLNQIDLGMAVYGSIFPGTTDITVTFNDGDPSGLVFGTGAQLYTTTLTNVQLPMTDEFGPEFFTLSIPLPNIVTSGGFNDVGWSVSVSNFNYGGSLGFQCGNAFGQAAGFYTNNASQYTGGNWSLFAFGGDPNTGVANFVATIHDVPEPTSLALLGLGAIVIARRRP